MLAEAMVVGFVCSVIALTFGLVATFRDGIAPQAIARLDSVLLANFCMFLFVAWCFEPAVVYLCGWEGLQTRECQQTLTGRLWLFYAEKFDPIFLNLPLWLRIVCSLDTILFGPFYAVSIYAFATVQQETRWYSTVALPTAGALIYSTIVYFAYECMAEAHRASLLFVFLVNLPWTLAPVLLILRLGLVARGSSSKSTAEAAEAATALAGMGASPSRLRSSSTSNRKQAADRRSTAVRSPAPRRRRRA